jgi:hypothetical protein
MNSFAVTQALYDPTGSDPNPLVTIRGTVNGKDTFLNRVYWAAIQQANVVAGVLGVQALLGPTFLGFVQFGSTGPYPPVPVFTAAKIPLPIMGQGQGTFAPNGDVIPVTLAVCAAAMVPAWSA